MLYNMEILNKVRFGSHFMPALLARMVDYVRSSHIYHRSLGNEVVDIFFGLIPMSA